MTVPSTSRPSDDLVGTAAAGARIPAQRNDVHDQLRSACGGALHVPGDPGYDAARMPWNLAVEQRPAAVAYPADAGEVAAVVRVAAAAGLRVAPQGTGHNAGPLPALDDVVLLRTSAMTGTTVDVERRTVRVGAGTLWLDVVEAVAPHGLAALHGSSPDVGVVGYSLGGGIGWYARQLGLQTNSITAVELVTGEGESLRVDAQSDPELFWALRGGGGNLGVVTALEFALYPIETAYAGWLVWDWSQSERVLRRWAEWAPDAPDHVTTAIRILQLPPIEAVPEPLRGKNIVAVDGAVLGSDEEAERLLAPLRELGPDMDTFTRMPSAALVRLHGDPEGPTPGMSDTTMLRELPPAAVDAFVEASGPDAGSALLLAELRQLGGALGRPHEGGGALSRLDAAFVAFCAGIPVDADVAARVVADGRRLVAGLAPWATGGSYSNFAEHPTDGRAVYGASYERLRAVRRRVDPAGVVLANHPV